MGTTVGNRTSTWLSNPMVWGILWLVLYFGARGLLESDSLQPWQRVASALAPIPIAAVTLVSIVRGARQLDELELRIQLEALAIAYPLAIVLIMLLALVQLAMPLNPDDWSYRHIWPFLPMFWLGGQAIARRRYQ